MTMVDDVIQDHAPKWWQNTTLAVIAMSLAFLVLSSLLALATTRSDPPPREWVDYPNGATALEIQTDGDDTFVRFVFDRCGDYPEIALTSTRTWVAHTPDGQTARFEQTAGDFVFAELHGCDTVDTTILAPPELVAFADRTGAEVSVLFVLTPLDTRQFVAETLQTDRFSL